MPRRIALVAPLLSLALVCLLAPRAARAQSADSPARLGASGWRAPSGDPNRYAAASPLPTAPTPGAPAQALPAAAPLPAATRAQVTKGSGTLPNESGQVWREYDITPYTLRNSAAPAPEQAIVDWILRETGYEAWHATPVGLLSADRKVLRVYHTPQMQAVVADIVDRFVSTQSQHHGFGLRIITLKNPNWRVRALPLMTPIPVESPGVQGWIMAREDAALLVNEFRRRTDYREQTTPNQMVLNGQSQVINTMRPITYTKGIILNQQVWPGYQPDIGQIEEGFTLEFSPLLSTDGRTTDAVVKLKLAQVERMIAVQLEAPSTVAQNQRAEVQVPQLTMVQLHERFRWPTDHVLLLSMGVVATPGPDKPNPVMDVLPLPKSAPRADALLMVESTGTISQSPPPPTGQVAVPHTASLPERTFHGRY